MAIMTNQGFSRFLWPNVNSVFGLKFKEHAPEWPQFLDKYTTDKAFVEDVGLVGFGYAETISEMGSITYDEAQTGYINRYNIFNKGLGFMISQNLYEDGGAEMASLKKATALSRAIAQTIELDNCNILNSAFDATKTMGVQSDGSCLCSATHPRKSGGTWSNVLATPASISHKAVEQALIDIGNFDDDRGLPINVRAMKLLVSTKGTGIFDAARILKSGLQSDNANNAINAIKETGQFPQGCVGLHYMDDADAWFIKTDCPDGMKYFERRPVKFAIDNEFDTGAAKFKADYRCCPGWTDAHSILGSQPA